MKVNKTYLALVASTLLFLSGCGAILPSLVKSSSSNGVHMQYGDESGAREKATEECKKWGKTEAVLRQHIRGEIPSYYYDCK